MEKVNTHMSVKDLIEAVKNRKVTEEDYDAFVERCHVREKEFQRMADRQKPDAAFYNFQYGIKNETQ